jgi:hypothetical protein
MRQMMGVHTMTMNHGSTSNSDITLDVSEIGCAMAVVTGAESALIESNSAVAGAAISAQREGRLQMSKMDASYLLPSLV